MKRTFYKNQIAEQVVAATVPLQTGLSAVEKAVVPTAQPIDERIADAVNFLADTVTAIPNYLSVSASRPSMRNDILKQNIIDLTAICVSQQAQIQDLKTESSAQNAFINAISNSLSDNKKQTSDSFTAFSAQLELLRSYAQSTQAQLALNQANDNLLLARTSVLESQQIADALADSLLQKHDDAQDAQLAALDTRTTLSEANIIKTQAIDKTQDAQIALLAARATTDEAAIAAAQSTADKAQTNAAVAIANAYTAQAKADTAHNAATAAQASATQAINAAASAQSKADANAIAVVAAQSRADAAYQASLTNAASIAQLQADVLTKLPSSAVRRFNIATPAVTLVVSTPATFTVTIPAAFADNNYFVFFTKASGSSLLNVQLADTNKTASTFTVTMQTTGAVNIAVAASSAEVLIIHA